ncbi:MAG: fibronectin type III domain-containing protein [Acidobacteriota bacterium]
MAIVGTAATLVAKGVAKEVGALFAAELAAKAAEGVKESAGAIAGVIRKILGDGSGYITEIVVSNETSYPIQLFTKDTIHGKFLEKHGPSTSEIKPGQSDVYAHTASAGFYGSQGNVVYTVRNARGDYEHFVVGWDNVFSGDNHLRLRFGKTPFSEDQIDNSPHRAYTLAGHGLNIVASMGNDEKPRLNVTVGYGARPPVPRDLRAESRSSSRLRLIWEGSWAMRYRVLADQHANDTVETFRTFDSHSVAKGHPHRVTFDDLESGHSYGFCAVAINENNLGTVSPVEVIRTRKAEG